MTQILETITDFKTVRHDIVPYTYTPGASFILTIPHNLGFIPVALLYVVDIVPTTKEVAFRFPLPGDVGGYSFTFGSAKLANWCDYTVDRTNLRIVFKASLPGNTNIRNFDGFDNPIYFEYFLFEGTAN